MSVIETVNILTFSGGKDSTAMWLYAREQSVEVMPVFCDTGHEHRLTYEYVDYLESKLGPVRRVKADFAERIANKRLYVEQHWPRKLTMDVPGRWYTDEEDEEDEEEPLSAPDWEPEDREQEGVVSEGWTWLPFQKGLSEAEASTIVETALSALHPTGNPFLDLCLLKGRFPSTKARFCTVFLKVVPTFEQVYFPLIEGGWRVVSWQGVRGQESKARAKLAQREDTPEGYEIYRPLLKWSVDDVFAIHRKHDIEPNPLYKMGMGRVGCFPCINAGKAELFEIARRFPDEIKRVAEWEKIVGMASKRQAASFFKHDAIAGNGIEARVEWSKTTRGGRMYDLIKLAEMENTSCSSQYGLCE